jgi:hypothetical protein
MKAISLWQPWASAMAFGFKCNETRSWPTQHRGDLVICASKQASRMDLLVPRAREAIVELMPADGFPYGMALCVVDLWECVRTDHFHGACPIVASEMEASLGDYTPGRFAWITRNLRVLRKPVPIRGRQGIWNLTASEESDVIGALL